MHDTAAEEASLLTNSLPSSLASVEAEIVRACNEARRARADVTLIAVSKTFGADAVLERVHVSTSWEYGN